MSRPSIPSFSQAFVIQDRAGAWILAPVFQRFFIQFFQQSDSALLFEQPVFAGASADAAASLAAQGLLRPIVPTPAVSDEFPAFGLGPYPRDWSDTRLIQDTAANIGNYPAAAFPASLFIAADSEAVYRSDGVSWTLVVAPAALSDVLFDHFIDAGNGTTVETDLYSDTLIAGQLGANGAKIRAAYAGVFVSSATATREIQVYFGGTSIFDSGALTLSLSSAWTMAVTIIRVSASVVRCAIEMATEGAALAAYTAYTEVTGLTLANTQVLKITGQAAGVGAATGDITAKLGYVEYLPAA